MQDIDLGEVTDRDWKCATFKQEEDFTDRAAACLAEWGPEHAARFKKEGRVDEAVEQLLAMEKKTRLGGDAKNCIKVATGIMKLLVAAAPADKMMDYAELVMKRRAQMKGVQIVVVKEAHKSVEQAPDKDTVVMLLRRLRDICSGKLHVELEFARISVQLADIFEKDGNLKDAVAMMNDVQVETITNMDRKEKLTILLLQIRLNLDNSDYIRAAIMARKTSNRAISKPDSMEIKVQYFEYMLRYYAEYKSYWHLAKCWMELYKTVISDEFQKEHAMHPMAEKGQEALTHVLLFLMLSTHSTETESTVTDCAAFSSWNKSTDRLGLIKEYAAERAARHLDDYQLMVKQVQGSELIHWPVFADVNAKLLQHPVFACAAGEVRWADLHRRITEHNIKVIGQYYQRIKLVRLAQLIDLNVEDTEQSVCDLVMSKDLWARVDRIDGVITFERTKDSATATAEWADGIAHVLGQVSTACHLIQKEFMLNGVAQP